MQEKLENTFSNSFDSDIVDFSTNGPTGQCITLEKEFNYSLQFYFCNHNRDELFSELEWK